MNVRFPILEPAVGFLNLCYQNLLFGSDGLSDLVLKVNDHLKIRIFKMESFKLLVYFRSNFRFLGQQLLQDRFIRFHSQCLIIPKDAFEHRGAQ